MYYSWSSEFKSESSSSESFSAASETEKKQIKNKRFDGISQGD